MDLCGNRKHGVRTSEKPENNKNQKRALHPCRPLGAEQLWIAPREKHRLDDHRRKSHWNDHVGAIHAERVVLVMEPYEMPQIPERECRHEVCQTTQPKRFVLPHAL